MGAQSVIVFAIEVIAVLTGAFSGFAEARKKRVDPVGVFAVAFVTAFGGGTLRDLLLDRRPFFWVLHYEYVVLILILTLLATPAMRLAQRFVPTWALVLADAIALGFFSITGSALALAAGMPHIIAVMMGVITGVCGGLLRDVVLNEVPMVLRDGRPYALAALIGCAYHLILIEVGASEILALWTAAALIVAIRLIALWRGWTLK